MDKLIELLNEYEDGMVSWVKEYSEEFGVFILNTEQMIEEEIIISKSFGFIQWLVKNGKIDFDKCGICYEINSTHDHYNLEKRQDLWLIMLLSISSSPIKDLVSYLR